ncbi:MAG: MBL fold metallo-hydrolase [Clostridia bacterium]|nr:MBL fold metallo-hydrolase [Clostridia bacterium]MBQ4158272.1 MBL fold metallo-hydrolase [Clostridia bacterium]
MKIRWNGHACFTITSESGTVIVTDPFDPEVGYDLPKDNADIVTISHSHHDHNYTSSLTGKKVIADQAGTYDFGDVQISAIDSFHDECEGKKRGRNLIVKITTDGKSVVHLGDLGHMPDDKQLAFIKDADILLIPIGGTYTIDTGEAVSLIEKANAKTVIPMHFLTDKLRFPITDEKEFVRLTNAAYSKEREVHPEGLPQVLVLPFE